MVDRKFIGYESEPRQLEVEKGQIRFFAKVIGETNPIHFEEEAARAAGHRGLVAPLTFGFCLSGMVPETTPILDVLGVEQGRILHGEQEFFYDGFVCSGDVLTFKSKITDIYDKKGGALEFIVRETLLTNQLGEDVIRFNSTIVVR